MLDKYFYDDFFKYYSNYSSINVSNLINSNMELFTEIYDDGRCDVLIMEGLNVAKTAGVIGTSYFKFCEQVTKKASFNFPKDQDLNKFMFDIAFIYLYNNIPEQVSEFLGVKLSPRDIYAEVAEQLYGDKTEESIEKIKTITTDDSYGIKKDLPKSRDRWFFNLCLEVGSNSKCLSRKIGAILVRDKSVIATGYNGPPRGIPTCDNRWFIDKEFLGRYGDEAIGHVTKGKCPRYVIGFKSGEGLDVCVAGHAERNALINAARLGIETRGFKHDPTTLYMSCGIPCTPCMVEIINAGVSEIVVTAISFYDQSAEYLLQNSELKVRLFDFLK
jgi:dCMP deaminase